MAKPLQSLQEQLKAIKPALFRAQELEKSEPKMAYYMYLYAVLEGMELRANGGLQPEAEAIIKEVLDKLERMKKAGLQLDPEQDAAAVEDFALQLFVRADRVDKAGRATANTAKTFYAAAVFLSVSMSDGRPALRDSAPWLQQQLPLAAAPTAVMPRLQSLTQFSPDRTLQPDIEEKARYAMWKAADINKAIRQGRTPTPGTPESEAAAAAPPPPTSAALPGGGAGSTAAMGTGAAALPPSFQPAQPPPPPAQSFPGPQAGSSPGGSGSAAAGALGPPGAGAAGSSPQARYRVGQKVYHFLRGSSPTPMRGTVARVSRDGAGWQYHVALSDRIVEAGEEELAPDYAPGDAVLLTLGDGSVVEACIGGMSVSRWRPSYTVAYSAPGRAGEAELETTDDRLLPAAPPLDRGFQGAASEAGGSSQADEGSETGTPTGPGGYVPRSDLARSLLRNSAAIDRLARDAAQPQHQQQGAADPAREPTQGDCPAPSAAGDSSTQQQPPGPSPDAAWSDGPAGLSPAAAGQAPPPRPRLSFRQADTTPGPPASYPPPPAWQGGAAQGRGQPQAPAPSSWQPPPPPASPHLQPGPQALGDLGGQERAQQPPPAQQQPPHGAPPASIPQPTAGFHPTPNACTEAQKYAKFAASSLSFDDTNTAIKYLTNALKLLTQPGGQV